MYDELGPVIYRDAAVSGITLSTLRSSGWTHPSQSLYLPPGYAGGVLQECRALREVLADDAVFTHVTAASVRGWWLPTDLCDAPIIACTNSRRPHHNRRGVYVRRCATDPAQRTMYERISVTTAARTLAELAEDLNLLDLVPAMDSALHLGHCTGSDLAANANAGRRGNKQYQMAIELADGRSESPWESVLRLLHLWSGVPVEP